jgi:hypothetical protein
MENDLKMKRHLSDLQVTLITMAVTILGGLAIKYWTDHNSHDPGVTILEVSDYSLDDLSDKTAS